MALVCLEDEGYVKDPNIELGTLVVAGRTLNAKVTYKENIGYNKSRGDDHPLLKLMRNYDELGPMVKCDYKDKGKAIGDLIQRFRDGELLTTDNEELAEALAQVRTTKKGKSSVVIEERVDVQATEGKDGPAGDAAPLY